LINLEVFGNHGESRAGSKLSFGDFGRPDYAGMNVFIGEYDITDTDQLWLHGKNGIYLTNNAGTVVAYFDVNQGNKFSFNCDVYANGVKLTSDERLKEKVRPLNNSLPLLKQLKGISYSLKTPATGMSVDDGQNKRENASLSEKERQDKAFFEEWEKNLQKSGETRLGFIAQELKEVFPEVVSEDKEGLLSVDYIGLIPVIVEGIKEQQQIIEAQEERINALEKAIKIFMDKSIVAIK
jgi:hypothetical protein